MTMPDGGKLFWKGITEAPETGYERKNLDRRCLFYCRSCSETATALTKKYKLISIKRAG